MGYLIDTSRLREGFYTAKYFTRTHDIAVAHGLASKNVTMQIFQRHEGAVLAGMPFVMEYLKEMIPSIYRPLVKVKALPEGSILREPWKTVMLIEGPYIAFGELQSVYLGILAQSTRIATMAKQYRAAAREKSLVGMFDRFNFYPNQLLDGHAAIVGGFNSVCTDAMGEFDGYPAGGTIPHDLINLCGGDIAKACQYFDETVDKSVPRIALVDYNNDCVADALEAARVLGDRLWGVRLDTSRRTREDLPIVDESIDWLNRRGQYYDVLNAYALPHSIDCAGVSPLLPFLVRSALDSAGFGHVRIVVSGGFTPERIWQFENYHVPVDAYGVGSSLLNGGQAIDFTADIVRVEGKPFSKVGRDYNPNDDLMDIDLWPASGGVAV